MLRPEEDMEELELLHNADGDIKWYKHFGRQFGSFQKIETYTHHM